MEPGSALPTGSSAPSAPTGKNIPSRRNTIGASPYQKGGATKSASIGQAVQSSLKQTSSEHTANAQWQRAQTDVPGLVVLAQVQPSIAPSSTSSTVSATAHPAIVSSSSSSSASPASRPPPPPFVSGRLPPKHAPNSKRGLPSALSQSERRTSVPMTQLKGGPPPKPERRPSRLEQSEQRLLKRSSTTIRDLSPDRKADEEGKVQAILIDSPDSDEDAADTMTDKVGHYAQVGAKLIKQFSASVKQTVSEIGRRPVVVPDTASVVDESASAVAKTMQMQISNYNKAAGELLKHLNAALSKNDKDSSASIISALNEAYKLLKKPLEEMPKCVDLGLIHTAQCTLDLFFGNLTQVAHSLNAFVAVYVEHKEWASKVLVPSLELLQADRSALQARIDSATGKKSDLALLQEQDLKALRGEAPLLQIGSTK